MPSCVGLRSDYSASELRHVAKKSKDNQSGEEALVAWGVRDGLNRVEARADWRYGPAQTLLKRLLLCSKHQVCACFNNSCLRALL